MQIEMDEKSFPGINQIENTFRSWQWIYGKTPRFFIQEKYDLSSIENQIGKQFLVKFEVFHGMIVKLETEPKLIDYDLDNVPFTIEKIEEKLKENTQTNSSLDLFIRLCILNCAKKAF